MDFFGTTPPGILLLDFILIAMGAILSPILWGILKRMGDVANHMKNNNSLQTQILANLTKIVDEQNEARIRDKEIEGRLKGVNENVTRLEQKIDTQLYGKQ